MRGYFVETYNHNDMHDAGLDMKDNRSMSTKGVLRGLHFQEQYSQGKLIHVIYGAMFDGAVDLSSGRKNYSQWGGVELSEENNKQFYVSEGILHGFLVMSDMAKFC